MIKKILSFYTVISMLATVVAVSVFPGVAAEARRPEREVKLPKQAVQVEDNVFSLGEIQDPQTGQMVEGFAIIHYKEGKGKIGTGKNARLPACYGYLASGAKWKVVEPWQINPLNSGLDNSAAFSILNNGIVKWEDAADGVINNVMGANILGDGFLASEDLISQVGTLNGKNEVYFGSLNPGIIAVTYVWGIFSGPTYQRKLVEWDQVYNTYYPWSSDVLSDPAGSAKMDFDNIATHELGHSVGMNDLYNSVCSQETMYGYANFGEILKRSLNYGDIAGINKLY